MKDGILKILFFGDVCGSAGTRALRFSLSSIKDNYQSDFVIVNGENSDKGYGISEESYLLLKSIGVDVITLGNHALEKEDIYKYLDNDNTIIRPCNFKDTSPGLGSTVVVVNGVKIAVINLHTVSGILSHVDCPFKTIDKVLKSIPSDVKVIIVDLHGEETYEKEALFFYLKNRVTAVLGTHTHVQTADERILDGTAYITDVGCCGVIDSVIGGDAALSVLRGLTCVTSHITEAQGKARLQGVALSVDSQSGKCLSIERISIDEKE